MIQNVSGARPDRTADGTTAPPERPLGQRRRYRVALVVVAAVGVVLLLYTPTPLSLAWAPLAHVECLRGTDLENQTFYAPGAILNSPFGGKTWVNTTFPRTESLYGGTSNSNGTSGALFATTGFMIFESRNSTVIGPGSNAPCSQPFLVEVVAPRVNGFATVTLQLNNSTTDANLPSTMPGRWTYPSVVFDASYHTPATGSISTCGTDARSLYLTTSSITVGIPVTTATGTQTLPVQLSVTAAFHYWFPGGFGSWSYYDLSTGKALPGAGLAFVFEPC